MIKLFCKHEYNILVMIHDTLGRLTGHYYKCKCGKRKKEKK